MNITDFTTEELRAELKRRNREKLREVNKNNKPKYLYAIATVNEVEGGSFKPFSGWRWKVSIHDKYINEYKIYDYRQTPTIDIIRSLFNKTNCPKEGDIVKLKCRITKSSPTWNLFNKPRICEIIKK